MNGPAHDILVPDGSSLEVALARTTHLGIGAHPDDLEIIAIPGILDCLDSSRDWFTGVVACDGAGSPRSGPYASYSDEQMVERRRQEQRDAARLGRYSAVLQLGYSSDAVKSPDSTELIDELERILRKTRPSVVYLHNLADRHATHRALARASIAALRRLPAEVAPDAVYGVEVWGSLDWCPPPHRIDLPLHDTQNLQELLLRCHDSQVTGGKRYDLAIVARQRANATLAHSHDIDRDASCLLAMDLAPLLAEPALTPEDFLERCLDAFRQSLAR